MSIMKIKVNVPREVMTTERIAIEGLWPAQQRIKTLNADFVRYASPRKRQRVAVPHGIQLGLEVETCITQPMEFNMFDAVDDTSIRCRSNAFAQEYVLKSPIPYVKNSPEVAKITNALRHIMDASSECENSSCGTHVHMSLMDKTVQDDPLLFVILQQRWMDEFEPFQRNFKLRDTFYTKTNDKVWSVADLGKSSTKYYALNMRPTIFYKGEDSDDEWLHSSHTYSRRAAPWTYHVEFRSMGDFHTNFEKPGTRLTGTFAEATFLQYLDAMATFLRECVDDTDVVKRIKHADLSGMSLSTISEQLVARLRGAESLTMLDLSFNCLGSKQLKIV